MIQKRCKRFRTNNPPLSYTSANITITICENFQCLTNTVHEMERGNRLKDRQQGLSKKDPFLPFRYGTLKMRNEIRCVVIVLANFPLPGNHFSLLELVMTRLVTV